MKIDLKTINLGIFQKPVLFLWNRVMKLIHWYWVISLRSKKFPNTIPETFIWMSRNKPDYHPFWRLPYEERLRLIKQDLLPDGDLGRRIVR